MDRGAPHEAPSRVWSFAAGLAAGLVVLAALAMPSVGIPIRVVLALAAVVGFGVSLRARRRPRAPAAWVELDGHGVARVEGERRTTLLEWGEPSGVTILANCVRTRVLVAFTSRSHTRYLRVRTTEATPEGFAWIGRHAVSVADGDLSSPDDEPELEGDAAVELLERCIAEDRRLMDRVYLTSARGEPVEVRLRQLSALFDSRHLFAADPLREAEDEALRRRWQQLRETLGGA